MNLRVLRSILLRFQEFWPSRFFHYSDEERVLWQFWSFEVKVYSIPCIIKLWKLITKCIYYQILFYFAGKTKTKTIHTITILPIGVYSLFIWVLHVNYLRKINIHKIKNILITQISCGKILQRIAAMMFEWMPPGVPKIFDMFFFLGGGNILFS